MSSSLATSPNLTSFVLQVFPGTLAAQYFVPGDIVLGIQGYSAKDLLHVEAIDLIRKPVKNLELLVQKVDHIPESIWGPPPVLHRPSEWLRRSTSPFSKAYLEPKTECRPASMMRQHSETVAQNAFQKESTVRTVYAPSAFDSRMQQQFGSLAITGLEESTKMPQAMYQTQVVNQVSSATQYVDSDFSHSVTTDKKLCDNAQEHGHIYREVQKANHNLHKTKDYPLITPEIPQITNHKHEPHERIGKAPEKKLKNTNAQNISTESSEMSQNVQLAEEINNELKSNSNIKVAGKTEEQCTVKLGFSGSRHTEECKVKHVTDKPRTQTTADILKRPLSPEFTMFPNSKSTSLLKLVLNKSLGNYSPQDFEKMKASATEIHDESDENEDSDIEEDEEEDADDTGGETPRSMSCDSSLAGSGSLTFERYWMAETDDLVQQYGTSCESLSRNSSRLSASSPLPDSPATPDDYTG